MKINFDGADRSAAHTHVNAERGAALYRDCDRAGKASRSGFVLDLDGLAMGSGAYADRGRTIEEVAQAAGQEDITARRNYMAVMSGTMSDEDFARMQREGFHPGSTDIETVVTVVDRIKAALLMGGAEVTGYTDTLDMAELEDITGSPAFARTLKNQFEEKDIPLTRENAEAVMEAWNTMNEVPDLPEGSVKYMVENGLDPTVENLYMARYSAVEDAGRQGRGYYEAGSVSGYYARKPENIDYEKLMPQIEKVIEEAGFSVEEDTRREAMWLIEKGIPLNEDTFLRMHRLSELNFPAGEEDFARSAAAAIADGISPSRADISQRESQMERAAAICEKTRQLDERAVDVILARELPYNLKNLIYVSDEIKKGTVEAPQEPERIQDPETIKARRMLEEVRLSMTVTANLRLLRSGFHIETAPMERLVENLKKAEGQDAGALVQEADAEKARAKSGLYQQTLFTLESIRNAPAAVAAQVSDTDTLPEVESAGRIKEAQYQRAGESYEALMTAPRKDMGDSIRKAFQNVDDILADLGREITQENRKVIRIMGYNSMEMTEENFESIRHSEALLTQVVGQMKPQTVLSMIREGVNPLTMSLEELKAYLDGRGQDMSEELESYSRFLYKLEKKNNISEEERSAYIGIYRLLRQVEKGDDAAVGALVQTGVSQTLDNLLAAVRTSRRKHMDYTVRDEFAGVQTKRTDAETITEQIQKGYIRTRQDLEDAVEDEQTVRAQAEFEHTLFEEVRHAAGSEEAVLRQLMNYGQEVTADNLKAAGELLKGSYDGFSRFRRMLGESRKAQTEDAPGRSGNQETAEFAFREFPDKLTDRQTAFGAYEGLMSRMQQALGDAAFGQTGQSLDLKSMSILYKQITFMKSMAREENYEMPVRINGEVTAINLKMIHGDGKEARVAITLETELLGKCAAEFTYTKAGLSGYCSCSRQEGGSLMKGQQELFGKMLSEEKMEAGDIRFLIGKDLNLREFSLRISKDRISGQTPDALYRAAKVYIGFVQKISK